MLFGVTARIENLGNIGYPESEDGNTLLFDDGFITLPTDPDADSTSLFGFSMENAKYNIDGDVTSFELNRYRSESTGQSIEQDIDGSHGWEVTYDYFWGSRKDRWRLGVRAGFAINDLDFDSSTVVHGRLLVQTARINLGPGISYSPGGGYDGRNGEGGPSVKVPNADEAEGINSGEGYMDPSTDLTVDAEHDYVEYIYQTGEEQVVASTVNTVFQSNGVMAMARVGPILSLRLAYGFQVEVSAGLLGLYYSSEISMYEVLTLPVTGGRRAETVFASESDVLWGYYAEGLLRYSLTDRVSFYTGMMYFDLQNQPKADISESRYLVTFDTPVIASAGVSVFF